MLDVICKTVATLIKVKLDAIAEPQIEECKAGFRRGSGTADQIFIMK